MSMCWHLDTAGLTLISASDLLRTNLRLQRQRLVRRQERMRRPPYGTRASTDHVAPCCRQHSGCAHMLRVLLLQEWVRQQAVRVGQARRVAVDK